MEKLLPSFSFLSPSVANPKQRQFEAEQQRSKNVTPGKTDFSN